MAIPNFLYRFWFNGVGTAGLLVVLDASPAPASSVPAMASSPPHPSAAQLLACCLPPNGSLSLAPGRPPLLAGGWPPPAGVGEAGRREHGLPRPGAPPQPRVGAPPPSPERPSCSWDSMRIGMHGAVHPCHFA
jgi:hypothetical protein